MAATTAKSPKLKAPFPYVGGKSRIAPLIWEALGDVDNFIDPFFGSMAPLLGRPTAPKVETVNDKNCFVVNFFRAIQRDFLGVASWASDTVNETDLQARHLYLTRGEDAHQFLTDIRRDPDYFDARRAGWWCWGQCTAIGMAWCDQDAMDRIAQGGITTIPSTSRPQLGDAYARGRGIHANDSLLTFEDRLAWTQDWFKRLQDRLRVVRVCCGDWLRVCDSPTVTTRLGICGIYFDPPYEGSTGRARKLYGAEDLRVSTRVRDYCLERGGNPKYRIVLSGMSGEHDALESHGWTQLRWKSSGYQNVTAEGRARSGRERVWLSPHCLMPRKEACPLFHPEEA